MNQRLIKHLAVLGALATTAFFFQNCSNKGFETTNLSSRSGTSNNQFSSSDDFEDSEEQSSGSIAAGLSIEDHSVGNRTIVTRLTQKIHGAKAGLKGCTGTMANYNTVCLNDSDFIFITSSAAWGANAYDAASDVYSVDADVSANGWPHTTYFTRYIAADGSRKEVTFTPAVSVQQAIARLQWVLTQPKACIGPTPAAAPLGESCSNEGETRTNECGTVTCQFK